MGGIIRRIIRSPIYSKLVIININGHLSSPNEESAKHVVPQVPPPRSLLQKVSSARLAA